MSLLQRESKRCPAKGCGKKITNIIRHVNAGHCVYGNHAPTMSKLFIFKAFLEKLKVSTPPSLQDQHQASRKRKNENQKEDKEKPRKIQKRVLTRTKTSQRRQHQCPVPECPSKNSNMAKHLKNPSLHLSYSRAEVERYYQEWRAIPKSRKKAKKSTLRHRQWKITP